MILLVFFVFLFSRWFYSSWGLGLAFRFAEAGVVTLLVFLVSLRQERPAFGCDDGACLCHYTNTGLVKKQSPHSVFDFEDARVPVCFCLLLF